MACRIHLLRRTVSDFVSAAGPPIRCLCGNHDSRIAVRGSDVVNADHRLGPPLAPFGTYLLAAIAPILWNCAPLRRCPTTGWCRWHRPGVFAGIGQTGAALRVQLSHCAFDVTSPGELLVARGGTVPAILAAASLNATSAFRPRGRRASWRWRPRRSRGRLTPRRCVRR
jgi:hypothetical protein